MLNTVASLTHFVFPSAEGRLKRIRRGQVVPVVSEDPSTVILRVKHSENNSREGNKVLVIKVW